MEQSQLIVATDLQFDDYHQVLQHLGEVLTEKGIVKASYPAALAAREAEFPTGIALENYAVAIPHCGAEHANQPAIYLIRPSSPVKFNQADDDSMVDAKLIIALVVTDPKQQLVLLRTLFTQLQDNQFVESLLSVPASQVSTVFKQKIFQQ